MSGVAPRLAAAELLLMVLQERRTLDEALVKVDSFTTLTGPDRGLARAIVSASLRQVGRLDAALDPLLKRPLEMAEPEVQAVLRIGAAQSWVLKMPDHAVVSATVDTAKRLAGARKASGFVNAILRKVVSDRAPFDAIPLEQVWPKWLRLDMQDSVGPKAALRLAQNQIEQPSLHLTPKQGAAQPLAERVEGVVLAGHTIEVKQANVEQLPGFDEGDWWVQDVAAALPVRLLGVKADQPVLDLCAAPGGKTLQLAALGANVTALDRSQNRLKRVHLNLARTRLAERVTVQVGDASDLSDLPGFEKILLDAPCSALGTLRRHPEGAWIKRAEDLQRFPAIQARLLRAALANLQPGGTLIYCVCTPLSREGVDLIEAVLEEQGGVVKRLPIQASEIPGFETCLTSAGDVLTLPGGTFEHDAFYIARLTRYSKVVTS